MKRIDRWVLACAKSCCANVRVGDGCKLVAREDAVVGTSTYSVENATVFETEEDARRAAIVWSAQWGGRWAPRCVSYRIRRGVLVLIPPDWVGKVTRSQTICKRPSKGTRKMRGWAKHVNYLGRDEDRRRAEQREKVEQQAES